MVELIALAAEIARGDYHPSCCVDDYKKGTGRVAFAEMVGECTDRMRGKIHLLVEASDRIAELEASLKQAEADRDALRTAVRAWARDARGNSIVWKQTPVNAALLDLAALGEATSK